MKKISTMVSALLATAFIAAGTQSAAAGEEASGGEVVNINTATTEELSFLPGVGPSKAQAIVKYRGEHPFKAVEHIQRVKGIGRKSFNNMKPYLRLDGPTTLKKKVQIKK